MFNFNNYIRKKNEEVSLQILQSILETNNPIEILDQISNFLYTKNKKKLAELFENAKNDIEFEAKDILDSFYENYLITERTYRDLKSIEQLSTLDYKTIENLISQREEEKKFSNKILFIILKTIGMSLFTLLIALPSLIETKKLELPALRGDIFEGVYRFIILNPVAGIPTVVIIVFLLVYFTIDFVSKRIIEGTDALFRFVNYVTFFREAKIPYSVILNKYIESFPKDAKKLPIQDILEVIDYESANEAFTPLINKLPINESVVAREKIGSESGDIDAWRFLKNRIFERLNLKFASLEKMSNSLYYLFLILILLFAFYPLGLVMMSILNKTNF